MTDEERSSLAARIMAVADCGAHRADGQALEVVRVRPFVQFATVPCGYVSRGAAASCSECAKKLVAAFEEWVNR